MHSDPQCIVKHTFAALCNFPRLTLRTNIKVPSARAPLLSPSLANLSLPGARHPHLHVELPRRQVRVTHQAASKGLEDPRTGSPPKGLTATAQGRHLRALKAPDAAPHGHLELGEAVQEDIEVKPGDVVTHESVDVCGCGEMAGRRASSEIGRGRERMG